MKRRPPPAEPMTWPRADPAELARFDPRTKVCTMNCGPSSADPRTAAERQLLCTDCLPADPVPRLTPEQRARLISGGPNAGRVRRDD